MITPALTLSFASATLDPRITLTRSGNTATRVNASGYIETVNADTPRFDYDPVTLACRGLLVEEQRANSLTYSNTLSNAAWSTSNMTVGASAEISPNGTTDAFLLTASSTNAFLYRTSGFAASATSYTISCYCKQGTTPVVNVDFVTAGYAQGARARFVLSTGTVSTITNYGSVTGTTASIVAAGNDWYRCSISLTVSAGNYFVQLLTTESGKTIHACNAQLEAGALATSYIPTTTTAITRNADVATITGANFSSWWQETKGGAVVRARPGTVSGTRPWVQFDDGTTDNIIALRGNTTNPELYIKATTDQAQIDAGTISADTSYALTGVWDTNNCAARLDAGTAVFDASATIPVVTQARLGSDGTNYLNGHLELFNFYDQFYRYIYTRRKNKAVFSLL